VLQKHIKTQFKVSGCSELIQFSSLSFLNRLFGTASFVSLSEQEQTRLVYGSTVNDFFSMLHQNNRQIVVNG
jgi:hypothetical protein